MEPLALRMTPAARAAYQRSWFDAFRPDDYAEREAIMWANGIADSQRLAFALAEWNFRLKMRAESERRRAESESDNSYLQMRRRTEEEFGTSLPKPFSDRKHRSSPLRSAETRATTAERAEPARARGTRAGELRGLRASERCCGE